MASLRDSGPTHIIRSAHMRSPPERAKTSEKTPRTFSFSAHTWSQFLTRLSPSTLLYLSG